MKKLTEEEIKNFTIFDVDYAYNHWKKLDMLNEANEDDDRILSGHYQTAFNIIFNKESDENKDKDVVLFPVLRRFFDEKKEINVEEINNTLEYFYRSKKHSVLRDDLLQTAYNDIDIESDITNYFCENYDDIKNQIIK